MAAAATALKEGLVVDGTRKWNGNGRRRNAVEAVQL